MELCPLSMRVQHPFRPAPYAHGQERYWSLLEVVAHGGDEASAMQLLGMSPRRAQTAASRKSPLDRSAFSSKHLFNPYRIPDSDRPKCRSQKSQFGDKAFGLTYRNMGDPKQLYHHQVPLITDG